MPASSRGFGVFEFAFAWAGDGHTGGPETERDAQPYLTQGICNAHFVGGGQVEVEVEVEGIAKAQ